VFIDRHNDDQVRVAPCCQASTAIESAETFDFKTSPHLQNIRQQFDQGLKPATCNLCWTAESRGQKSRRQGAIEFFNLPLQETTVELEAVDYSATWACNLACIMCGPQLSSTWAKEMSITPLALKEMGRKFQKQNKIQDRLDLSCIKKLHFNGGEPLLNTDQFEILDRINLSQVTISYNTNGTVYPSDRLIELWSRAKLVKLFFSIDAIGPQYEYIRYPGNWSAVGDNLQRMRQELPSNVMFSFNCTVGCYNAFEMMDVWKWFDDNMSSNREGDPSDFCWQLAYNYDIRHLLPTAKQDIIDQVSAVPQLAALGNYIKSVQSRPANHAWQKSLDTIDKRRGTNWKSTLQIGKYY
jgi:sulfatase maturation enzyme AslB (radical SAM superfamily)